MILSTNHSMQFNLSLHTLRAFFLTLCLAVLLIPSLSWGEEEEDTVGLFSAFQTTTSTASRAPKPLSQTAENITVVTADEIKQLNAHTLTDVLNTITGLQLSHSGVPGSTATTNIQSSANNQNLIMVDGVPLNSLGDNVSDISSIPARIIERIEIVKGAASSSWGQALGGVINVVTKSPEQGRSIGGSASASIGNSTTIDSGAELSGTSGSLGYYLSGGYLGSNGLLPHITTDSKNAYAKLIYVLPDRSQFWGTFRYSNANRGDVFAPDPAYDFQQKSDIRNLYATFGYRRLLTENIELELNASHAARDFVSPINLISDGSLVQSLDTKDRVSSGSAKLIWRGENNLLVVGADYEHANIKTTDTLLASDVLDRTVDRSGVYLNDTITLGPVSVTPGLRFDQTVTSGNQFSSSLGATWQLTDSTLLRAYTGRGYSLSYILLNNIPSEKVWATQFGVESKAVPYLWVKGTLFRNEIWDIQANDADGKPITERHIALGTELEVRTIPVLNTSLGAGWTFTDTTRSSDGSQIGGGVPRHTVQLSVRYDDKRYRAQLTGRHIDWNSNIEPGFNGKYSGLVWDLHLGATLLKRENSSLELFFSGHNLFNNDQYWVDALPTTGRWFEGGVRVNF